MRRMATRIALSLGLAASLAAPTRAGMVLTSGAQSGGFQLSTFASGFENDGAIGPIGVAITPNGSVLVGTWPNGKLYKFADADGQTPGSPLQTFGGGNAHSLATVGGAMYMIEKFNNGGSLLQIDPIDGHVIRTLLTNLNQPLGLTPDLLNGHLLLGTSFNGIFDIDPTTSAVRQITSTTADGVTTDGTTVYGAHGGNILGFNIASGALVFDSGPIGGTPDGTALGTGTLAGNIFVNTNGGTLVEVNLLTKAQTLIGTGGSRGDFVTVDSNNGSLLLTQTDSVLRLTAPPGGGFKSTPEPSSLVLGLIGSLGGLGYFWRRRIALAS